MRHLTGPKYDLFLTVRSSQSRWAHLHQSDDQFGKVTTKLEIFDVDDMLSSRSSLLLRTLQPTVRRVSTVITTRMTAMTEIHSLSVRKSTIYFECKIPPRQKTSLKSRPWKDASIPGTFSSSTMQNQEIIQSQNGCINWYSICVRF